MIYDDPPPPPPPPSDGRGIIIAVTIAAASTLATALATWAVDELRHKYGNAKPAAPEPSVSTSRKVSEGNET